METAALKNDIKVAKSSSTDNPIDVPSLDSAQTGYALQVMDAAIQPLVHHAVRKNLPEIMKKADPAVQTLCTLLEADLRTLKTQADIDYQELLLEQSQFIAENAGAMDPIEKRSEIEKLYVLEQQQVHTDESISRTEHSLQALAAAHHAIVTGEHLEPK